MLLSKKDDGKYYVGQHTSTDKNPMSNYWGSGAIIKKAIAKHGKDAFERGEDIKRRISESLKRYHREKKSNKDKTDID